DAARAVRVAHGPALDLDVARDRARPGERLTGLPLPAHRCILGRADGAGGHVFHVLVLVRRVPVAHGGSAASAILLREDARLRKPPGPVRRGTGSAAAPPRQFSPGLHAPGADQRRLRPRPAPVGRRSRRLSTPGRAARTSPWRGRTERARQPPAPTGSITLG